MFHVLRACTGSRRGAFAQVSQYFASGAQLGSQPASQAASQTAMHAGRQPGRQARAICLFWVPPGPLIVAFSSAFRLFFGFICAAEAHPKARDLCFAFRSTILVFFVFSCLVFSRRQAPLRLGLFRQIIDHFGSILGPPWPHLLMISVYQIFVSFFGRFLIKNMQKLKK